MKLLRSSKKTMGQKGWMIYRGIHWATHKAMQVQGYEFQTRSRGELKLGVWRKKSKTKKKNPSRLVIIPGFMDAAVTWIPLVAALSKFKKGHHKIDEWIILDFPSFMGALYFEKGFESYDHMVQFVNDTLDSFKPKVVVGHSLGGWLAAQYAVQKSEEKVSYFEKLILICPAGFFVDEKEKTHWSDPFKQSLEEGYAPIKKAAVLKEPFWFKYIEPVMESIFEAPELKKFFDSVKDHHFLEEKLHLISQKTYLIWGDKDPLIRIRNMPAWMKHLTHPKARPEACVIKKAGHVPHTEAPVRMIYLLKKILDEKTPKTAIFKQKLFALHR